MPAPRHKQVIDKKGLLQVPQPALASIAQGVRHFCRKQHIMAGQVAQERKKSIWL
jgi:hypothetical protein